MTDLLADGDAIEIPSIVHDTIASWRRVIDRAADPRGIYDRAAIELMHMHSGSRDATVAQCIVDAVYDLAQRAGLSEDDAQVTMARAASNGDGTRARRGNDVMPLDARDWRTRVIGAQSLCDRKYPEMRYIVQNMIPEGVTLLVGRPKLGKSWLALQVAGAVANGVSALVASDAPAHGDVLYLALEDGERRMQRRLTQHYGSRCKSWPSRLTIATTWRRLDQGGIDDLRAWSAVVAAPTLIVIDTLARVRATRGRDQTDYAADYSASAGLIALAHEHPGLAIIVAHHDRKMAADDVYDTVSGTLGLTGGVDGVLLLRRDGGGVTLHARGRDLIEDVEQAARFDRETCRWVILGAAAEARRTDERARVIDALRDGPLGVGAIMAAATLKSRNAADLLCGRMSRDGDIVRVGRGRYGLPNAATDETGGTDRNDVAESTAAATT